jgi:tRNA A-37 threonylcarbamoyl transferase component Bud32
MLYRELLGESLAPEVLERLSDRAWVTAHAHRVYKDKVNIVAELQITLSSREELVVIKYFGWRNRFSYWLSPVMRSRAQKAWDASWWLIKHGIAVPRPIAVYTRRRWGFVQQNFILTEKIDQHLTARQFLKSTADWAAKVELVKNLGQILRLLHAGRYLHRDLTLGNFLIAGNDRQQIYLVDLNRLVRRPFLTRSQRMHDLARMNLCTCRLRREHVDCLWHIFLNEYEPDRLMPNKKSLFKALRRRERHQRLKSKQWFGAKS